MGEKKSCVEFRYYNVEQNFPLLCLSGEKWRQVYKKSEKLHFHNLLEIGYCLEGSGEIILQDRKVQFEKGTCTIIPRNVMHSTESVEPCHWGFLFIDEELLLDFFSTKNETKVKFAVTEAIFLNLKENEIIVKTIAEIFNKYDEKLNYYKEKIMALSYFAVLEMNSLPKFGEDYLLDKNEEEMLKALKYIDRNFEEDIKISDIAKVCNMSEPYFRKKFKETVGASPLDHLNYVRINKACTMLTSTNDAVISIALACGYTSVSTFNRNFYRYIGISPSKFRQNNKSKRKDKSDFVIERYQGW